MPNAVFVAGMISDSFEAERSLVWRDMPATGFKKSAMYCGAKPCNDLYVVPLSEASAVCHLAME